MFGENGLDIGGHFTTLPFQGDENAYPPPHINQLKKQINKTLFCCFALLALQSNAATIHYQATDLTDTTMGEDLWRYSYSVSDHVFSMDTGFSIYFDPALYFNLQDPVPSISPDWDVLVNQPDPLFSENGIYDALALINTPSLLGSFQLTFIWLGLGVPSSQSYEIYDATFNVITSGDTLPNVADTPEPSSFWLFATGLWLFSRKFKFLDQQIQKNNQKDKIS